MFIQFQDDAEENNIDQKTKENDQIQRLSINSTDSQFNHIEDVTGMTEVYKNGKNVTYGFFFFLFIC